MTEPTRQNQEQFQLAIRIFSSALRCSSLLWLWSELVEGEGLLKEKIVKFRVWLIGESHSFIGLLISWLSHGYVTSIMVKQSERQYLRNVKYPGFRAQGLLLSRLWRIAFLDCSYLVRVKEHIFRYAFPISVYLADSSSGGRSSGGVTMQSISSTLRWVGDSRRSLSHNLISGSGWVLGL